MSLSLHLKVEVTIPTGVHQFEIDIAEFLANVEDEVARNLAITISN